MNKGAIADLDAAELALGDLDDGEHGIEGDDLGNHGIGLQRLAGGHRNRADDAVDRGTDLGALALGFGHRKLGLSLAQIGEKLVLLVGGDDAALDQRQLGSEIGLAFAHHGGGFRDLGLARLIERTARISPCLTRSPRRTLRLTIEPAARATALARLSASVRPERVIVLTCISGRTCSTATLKRGCDSAAAPLLVDAALPPCPYMPEPIHRVAAMTIRTAAMRLHFICIHSQVAGAAGKAIVP